MAISDNLRGIGLMCLSMAAFTMNDAGMKFVTTEVPLFQTIFLRGVIAVIGLTLYGFVVQAYQAQVSRRDAGLILLRCAAEIFATLTFLTALLHMPMANLSAIMQFLPLAVTLAAALFFGEKIGIRRLSAIVAGFVGVMIILQPGTDDFDIWSVVGILSVLAVVVRDLAVRRMSAGVPSAIVALGAAVSVMGVGLVLSFLPPTSLGGALQGLSGWVALSAQHFGVILAAGCFLIVGYLCAVTAMRWGDIDLVAPFRYTSLLWAIMLDITVFGTLPGQWTLVGSGIVVASGLYMLFRERSLSRQAAG